jgi:hypothetical protein
MYKRHIFETQVTMLYWALRHLVSHRRALCVLEIQFSVIESLQSTINRDKMGTGPYCHDSE